MPRGEINAGVIPSHAGQSTRNSGTAARVTVNPLFLLLDRTAHSVGSLSPSHRFPGPLSPSLFSSTQHRPTAKSHFPSTHPQFSLCGLHFIPLFPPFYHFWLSASSVCAPPLQLRDSPKTALLTRCGCPRERSDFTIFIKKLLASYYTTSSTFGPSLDYNEINFPFVLFKTHLVLSFLHFPPF